MNEDVPRLIRFPAGLWQAIDADAKRCKRSAVKQMEAVLSAYYKLGDVEISQENLRLVGELFPTGKTRAPVLGAEDKKKRRA